MSAPPLMSQPEPQYSVWRKGLSIDEGLNMPNTNIAPQLNKYTPAQQQAATNYLNTGNGAYINDYYKKFGLSKSLTNNDSGFLSGYGEAAGKWLKQNPMAPVAFGLQLWQGINDYNANKKYLNQQQDLLDLQKQAYFDNKARMDEQYSIWKNARAGSSL